MTEKTHPRSKLSSWAETIWKNICKRDTLSILPGGWLFGGAGGAGMSGGAFTLAFLKNGIVMEFPKSPAVLQADLLDDCPCADLARAPSAVLAEHVAQPWGLPLAPLPSNSGPWPSAKKLPFANQQHRRDRGLQGRGLPLRI